MSVRPLQQQFSYASHVRPYPGLRVSGDAAVVIERSGGLFAAMIDVLGHGHAAATVARRMDSYLHGADRDLEDVVAVVEGLHGHLRGGLGAAASVLWCERSTGSVHYLGVGNTVARCFRAQETEPMDSSDRRLTSRDGTLGQVLPSLCTQPLQLSSQDSLVMYTDGVSDGFRRRDYPMLTRDKPDSVARRLVERFGKDHDDSSALCVRWMA